MARKKMARRKAVHVSTRHEWPGGESPNNTIGGITVDLRVVYPHDTMKDLQAAEEYLTQAAGEARRQLQNKMLELMKKEGRL